MSNVTTANRYGRPTVLELETIRGPAGATTLEHAFATPPLRVMKPLHSPTAPEWAHVVAMSSSAGLMEGDAQCVRVAVGSGAALAMSSQAYEKVHRMAGPGGASRETLLEVAAGGRLLYWQQPVIPFAGSRFAGSTRIDLADATAQVAYAEVVSCGRVARGERFRFARFVSRVQVCVGGEPVFADNLVLDPAENDLEGLGFFEGCTHLASLVVLGPGCTEETFRSARELISRETEAAQEVVCADEGARCSTPTVMGGVTRLRCASGTRGWAVRLLGCRAQDLERNLARVAAAAGFPAALVSHL